MTTDPDPDPLESLVLLLLLLLLLLWPEVIRRYWTLTDVINTLKLDNVQKLGPIGVDLVKLWSMQVRRLSLKKLTCFHQLFKLARFTLDLQASAFPRGELSSTWCEGVHGTFNSKTHYVTGICNFDAEYTSTFDQKTLLKTRYSTWNPFTNTPWNWRCARIRHGYLQFWCGIHLYFWSKNAFKNTL